MSQPPPMNGPSFGQAPAGGGYNPTFGAPAWGPPPPGAIPAGTPPGYGQSFGEQPYPGQGYPAGDPTPYTYFGPPPPPRRPTRGPATTVFGVLAVLIMIVLGAMIANSLFGRGADNTEYANADYKPPEVQTPSELPAPRTYDDIDELLYRNPIDAQSVASPIRCDIGRINPRNFTDQQLEDHFNTLIGCEMITWDRSMSAAGWQLYRPSVTVYTGKTTTPCGEADEGNAFYCSANQQLYFSSALPRLRGIQDEVTNPTSLDLVMAHEFGHYVQGRTGQFAAANILARDRPESEQLLMVRRAESQADCYAGLYLASAAQSTPYTQADFENFLNLSEAIGSDNLSGDDYVLTTHPRGEARRYWTQTGLSTTEIGKCNTYNVSDERLTN